MKTRNLKWLAAVVLLAVVGGCESPGASPSAPEQLTPEAVSIAEIERTRRTLSNVQVARDEAYRIYDEESDKRWAKHKADAEALGVGYLPLPMYSERHLAASEEAGRLEDEVVRVRASIKAQVRKLEKLRGESR